MAEMRNDRPDGNRAPPSTPTTFVGVVQEFGLETLLHFPTEVHAALATEARREILAYLYGRDRTVPVAELADYLAAIGVEANRRRAVAGLRHTYLPKLDGAGMIRWNREEETIRLARAKRD